MNSNKDVLEKVRNLEAKIKSIASKYKNKYLSSSERNDAHREIATFKEQVEFFSFDIENKLQDAAKNQGLVVLNSLKELAAGIEKNISDNIPDSEFM